MLKLSFVYYLSKGRGYVMRSFCSSVCLSVCVQDYCKKSADFTEAWCYHNIISHMG